MQSEKLWSVPVECIQSGTVTIQNMTDDCEVIVHCGQDQMIIIVQKKNHGKQETIIQRD